MGVCDRKCIDSESTWSTGVRGSEGGVAVGLGGAGPLRAEAEPFKKRNIMFLRRQQNKLKSHDYL